MTSPRPETGPCDVVGKVLRRAEIAKMARRLQDRLALATYKTQHGQEKLSFNDVEAHLEKTIRRKRPSSSVGTSSASSSVSSEHPLFSSGFASSPLTTPLSSDDVSSSGVKASFRGNTYYSTAIGLGSRENKRIRSQSMAPPMFESSRTTWKSSHKLPESSPVQQHRNANLSSSTGPTLSFASEASMIPNSPPFGHISDEEENDLPIHSFSVDPAYHGSPPRTPPPTRSRDVRRKVGGEEGADLLLYLATSPSPANPDIRSSQIFPPSTPPSKSQALPSSMMNTSGMIGFNTPGQNFNFADFVNVTPSPAQGAFGSRTPLAARESRRRLTFDALVPLNGSPTLNNSGHGSVNKDSGLGMELGGELVSR